MEKLKENNIWQLLFPKSLISLISTSALGRDWNFTVNAVIMRVASSCTRDKKPSCR